MTAFKQSKSPDFFEDHVLDPMATASGNRGVRKPIPKKKVGFYLSEALLERFNRRFHQMKLDRMPIENKSAFVEMALSYALDDLEKGKESQLGAFLKNKFSFLCVRNLSCFQKELKMIGDPCHCKTSG